MKPTNQLTLLIALTMAAPMAIANPENPQVVQGNASFTRPDANTLNITNSRNAIINWQNFNIDRGQTTRFIQPDRSSAVLNRVLSNNPSSIQGNLRSNGRVFLINQHGLMVGADATIDTAGFFGSTLNLTDEDFLNGRLNFSGGGHGGINNQGYIHAGPGGNVVLIAPDIENGGVIEVDGGNVILAAGESIRISSLNDGSIEFDVQAPENTILNLGSIIARQGAARLFAGNLQHSGAINATGLVRNADGSISLVAQQTLEVTAGATLAADGDSGGEIRVQSRQGDVYFSGSASALGDSQQGGRIEILGDRVGLFGEASVDASGAAGGGEVLVGGDYQGSGDLQRSSQTQVGPRAGLHADALLDGDGGRVITWSDGLTIFQGEATARAGATGDGGMIEVSGKGQLAYAGSVDASAAAGEAGNVLFDPVRVTIEAGGTPALPINPYDFTDDPGQLVSFDPGAITAITDAGNAVTVRADENILVNDPIITNADGFGGDINLQAGQSILINANIESDGGNISLVANDPGADFTNRGNGVAVLTMAAGTTLDAGVGGNIELSIETGNGNGSGGDMILAGLVADHIILRIKPANAGSDILREATGGTITALSLFVDHEFSGEGTIGLPGDPLDLVVDNVGMHIHALTDAEATRAGEGIYVTAQGNSGADVTVGDTCYGNSDSGPGCDSFLAVPHTIRGLETMQGGAIELTVTGGGALIIAEPINFFGNASGALTLVADGDITTNPDLLATAIPIRGDSITLRSNTGDVNLQGGDGTNLDASLEVPLFGGGDITVSTPAGALILDPFGSTGDAFIIADNGTNSLIFDACPTCTAIAYDPRGNGSTETGVVADNYPIDVNWLGTTDFDWNTGSNWDSGAPPLGNADVTINTGNPGPITLASGFHDANSLIADVGYDLAISGSGLLSVGNNASLSGILTINGFTAGLEVEGNLTVVGSTVLGEGSLAVFGTTIATGPVSWNPAGSLADFSITGAGLFNANGGFNIGPGTIGETLTLDKTLVINGASTWSGDNTSITGTGSMVSTAAIGAGNIGTATVGVIFSNSLTGTLTKTGAGGLLSFTGGLVNDGLIDVQAGTVQTTTGIANNGTINVAFGAIFDSAAGFTNGAAGVLQGNGTLITPADGSGLFNLGTIQPGGPGQVGNLSITGDFTNLPGGNIVIDVGAPLPDPNQDNLLISGQASFDGTLTLNAVGLYAAVDGHQFNPISYLGGSSGAFATFVPPIGGETVTAAYNPTPLLLTLNIVTPSFIFDNNGGAGDLTWNDPLNWSSNLLPTINDAVDLGTFNVTIASAATASTLSLAAGGRLTITGGGLALANDSTLNGRLILQGGSLALGGSTLTLNGRFDWSGTSTISNGTLSMPAAGRFNITGGASNTFISAVANIAAPTNYSGGNLVLSNTTFNNSGNFTFQGDRLVNGVALSGFNSLDGSTLTKSQGAGVAGFLGVTTITSLGNVAVQSGTLDLLGRTVTLGAADVLSSGATGTLIANVVNAGGTVRPGGAGAVGQLSIQGSYTNTAGTLAIEIDGATTNDRLAVTGATNFGAAAAQSVLDVSYLGYQTVVGESRSFITCTIGCSSSRFGTLIQPLGIVHSVVYNTPAGQVRLVTDSLSIAWIGQSGGAWGNPANWSIGSVPGASSNVVLPSLNVAINGPATANSLEIAPGGVLTIGSAGNLSLASTLRVRSGATLNNSGTLAVTGLTTMNGLFSQATGANTTLAGLTTSSLSIYSHGGGNATVSATALFNGTLGVSGGSLILSGSSVTLGGPFDMSAGSLRFGAGSNIIAGSNNLWQGGTLRSNSGFQTLALQAGATLQLQGSASKTLRDIRLDMSQGDVNLFGDGNLVLVNSVIDNTNGNSFHNFGNASLLGDASSQFINNGGLYENVTGSSQIAVDFVNNSGSQVRVLSGSLTLLDADSADAGAYSTTLAGTLGFAAPRNLTGSLANAGTLAATGGTTRLTLPPGFTNTGNISLDQATLDLNGQTLVMPAGRFLSGRGRVENGQVVNNGFVLVGGPGQLGNLTLDGDYTQNTGSALVVEVFNNGTTSQFDTFTVTPAGNTTLNGGALVIGFTTNSAGLVLTDVSPLQLANGATGQFSQVIDVGGNILNFSFDGGVLTILGASPQIPDALIDDLVRFIRQNDQIREIIESNESLAQLIAEKIAERRQQEEDEEGSLICTPGA